MHQRQRAQPAGRWITARIGYDCRGAEGVSKILIVSLFAIPLILLLILFGGEVYEYLRDAWEGLQGQHVAAAPGELFEDDGPDGTPGNGGGNAGGPEPQDEMCRVQAAERQATANILFAYLRFYIEWLKLEGEDGTREEFWAHTEAHWTGALVYLPDSSIRPADTWGRHCWLGGWSNPPVVQLLQPSLRASSKGPDEEDLEDGVWCEIRPGPDREYGTADDLFWGDTKCNPAPDGW